MLESTVASREALTNTSSPTAKPNAGSPKGEAFDPTSVLFAGTGYDTVPDRVIDSAQVGMLDGRTIHFHFQFIEPELLRQYPAATYVGADEPIGALALSKVVAQRKQSTLPVQTLRSRFGGNFSIEGSLSEVVAAAPLLGEAFALLEATHLDWLPVLSIGAIEIAPTSDRRADFCAQIAPDLTPSQVAVALLSQSAENLACTWLSVEAAVLQSPDSNWRKAQAFAAQLFSTVMREEFDHRQTNQWTAQPELESPEVHLADFPLTRHLVNYWNRRWNRQAFLRGSVFDYAPTLTALYGTESN